MTNRTNTPSPRASPRRRIAYTLAAVIGVALLMLIGYAPGYYSRSSETPEDAAETKTTLITTIRDSPAPRVEHRQKAFGNFGKIVGASRKTSATISQKTTTAGSQTTEPLRQEVYLAALVALMEADGRDNALIHYALAFELAPPNPTDDQAALIRLVMDEGWDARAEPLLPYLLAWQAAIDKLHYGASLKYARGIGFEMGAGTPVPDFLKAQNASKMLAVYSRYLESQGQASDALQQIKSVLSMGRDFNSPENFLISNLIGTSMENVGLRQLSRLIGNNVLSSSELASAFDHLKYVEQGQPTIQSAIDSEMQAMIISARRLMLNPDDSGEQTSVDPTLANPMDALPIEKHEEEYRKVWAAASDFFSVPYWERDHDAGFTDAIDSASAFSIPVPNYADAEVRFLNATSKLRQQQIDIAAQRYVADFQAPPPDIDALTNQNYLGDNPVDPFTGKPFTYTPTENGYHLYGSGPNISSPNDPNIEWNPANGTFSAGVIRTR